MGIFRSKNCHGRLTSLVLWVLLTAAAALEVYDERPEDASRGGYQDEILLDTEPVNQKRGPELALAKDMLLYRLIQSLQLGDMHPKAKYRSDWIPDYEEPRHAPLVSGMNEKDGVVKRLTEALRGSGKNIPFRGLDTYRPQQKWKIKKGKTLGSQMVCYFKLCAFRSPM